MPSVESIEPMKEQPLLDYIAKYIDLTDADKDTLLSKVKYRRYLKGQFLVQQGNICQFLNFVVSGCLKTFHIDNEGQEHIIRFAIEDWWSTDMGSFVHHHPADCNVQCVEPTEVIQFSQDSLTFLYDEIPQLERFFRIIYQNAFINSEKRITGNLSLSAKERYLLFLKQYPQIEQRVPQYMIASYLGITKQYLSEIRNQLAHGQ